MAELAPVRTDDGRRSCELENAGGGKSNDDKPGRGYDPEGEYDLRSWEELGIGMRGTRD